MVQEFHLSVTPLGEDRYLVRTERVPPGALLAEEQVHWPVERWLAQAQQLLEDPMLSVLQAAGAGWPEELAAVLGDPHAGNGSTQMTALTLVDLGRELYNALFQGSLRDSWLVAQGVAHHQREVLRLRLGLRGDRLPRLPWEVMQVDKAPLATGTHIAFSRYRHGAVRPLIDCHRPLGEPVRVLLAIAAPQDQEALALSQEAAHLQAELARGAHLGLPPLELTLLAQPGCEELAQALEQGNFQVFHYAGHSTLNPTGGELLLVSRSSGLTERLQGEDLAGLLANNGIQLAVLNSCRSADTACATPGASSLAQALVLQGLPAVLAMAERIPDEVALTLARLFYRNLDQGYAIDLSLSRARQGLVAAYGSQQLYWALPVLYLHPHYDGHLAAPEVQAPELALEDPDELPLAALANATEASRRLGTGSEPSSELAAPAAVSSNGQTEAEAQLVESILADFRPGSAESRSEAPEAVETVAPPQQPLIVNVSPPTSPATPRRRWWLWGMLVGTSAIAGLTIALLRAPAVQQALPPRVAALLSQAEPLSLEPGDRELEAVATERLTALAIEQFSQGNLAEGVAATTALLDRRALPFANSALEAVPVAQLDQPAISFLRGRLAWQSVKAGADGTFSLDDARRYWRTAVQRAPQDLTYRNALGFALYAEGDYQGAQQTWYDALEQVGETELADLSAADQQQVLTAYAGLALSLNQLAAASEGNAATTLANQGRSLYREVLSTAPLAFQATALSQEWLWTEGAIADWQALAQK